MLSPDIILETTENAICLYFKKFIFYVIVRYTNIEAINHSNIWKILDVVKLKAFFSLLLTAGHLNQNNINTRTLWNKIYGQPIFRSTMEINRFKQILRFIHFDDKTTRTFRRAKDNLLQFGIFLKKAKKFAKILPSWRKYND